MNNSEKENCSLVAIVRANATSIYKKKKTLSDGWEEPDRRMLSSWAALGTGASDGLTGRSTSG